MNNLFSANKCSPRSRYFGISGIAKTPKIPTVFLKKAAVDNGYPTTVRRYISELPESLEFDDYLHELDVIDRLLKIGD